ncbi:anti-sigma factor [Nocardia sp. NPDC088792]|uniref:anti-sigma factor n=1 Tax=Nocardia sp. NPDC088792 TaxID=3364332 RepID=UPI003818AFBA
MNDGIAQQNSTPTTIGLRVSAEPGQLVMLRALAETVGLVADFGIGEVGDIRLALDEVATELVRNAQPGSMLDCDLAYDADGMTVQMTALESSRGVMTEESLSGDIVRTLTVAVHTYQEAASIAGTGFPTLVEFRWLRTSHDRRYCGNPDNS